MSYKKSNIDIDTDMVIIGENELIRGFPICGFFLLRKLISNISFLKQKDFYWNKINIVYSMWIMWAKVDCCMTSFCLMISSFCVVMSQNIYKTSYHFNANFLSMWHHNSVTNKDRNKVNTRKSFCPGLPPFVPCFDVIVNYPYPYPYPYLGHVYHISTCKTNLQL